MADDTPPHGTDSSGPFLTKREAADRLRVSLDTIDRAIADGRLRPYRVGTGARRLVRVRVADVDKLAEADR